MSTTLANFLVVGLFLVAFLVVYYAGRKHGQLSVRLKRGS
ncbi:hypothetical protein LCGC14_0517050 [marine sediment metagenome]|uniref:Uncharacterized protein n=1 Tax=marine sediment metagenome TaxID=412755 RepID=A0A0F9UL70_9ZZZZ